MQQWAHDYLLSNGYTEADFTGHRIHHHPRVRLERHRNESEFGAYGLPQALPGSKMVSAAPIGPPIIRLSSSDSGVIALQRYGSIQGAYTYWLANHCY